MPCAPRQKHGGSNQTSPAVRRVEAPPAADEPEGPAPLQTRQRHPKARCPQSDEQQPALDELIDVDGRV